MIKIYDIGVKKLIETFSNKIKVIGLQNDDSGESSENLINQAGLESEEDKVSFPVISVFRNPEIEIIDGSTTKRPSTYIGYSEISEAVATKLVAMRANLSYTIDVFDVTRASAEEVALKLYFRLRNNPEIKVTFNMYDYQVPCICEVALDPNITNTRTQSLDKSQMYKLRFSFKLLNVNIYDLISRELPTKIRWFITAELE